MRYEITILLLPRHRGLGEECTTSVHSFGWVEGSNPGLSLSFIRFQIRVEKRRFRHKKKRKCTNVARNEEKWQKRGSGESKKKNRQAFQEGLRERRSVRYEDD